MYSKSTIEQILTNLKITDKNSQNIFSETLNDASETYLSMRDKNDNRLTESKENKKFEQLENYLRKTKETYSDLTEVSQASIFRFTAALRDVETENEFEKKILLSIFQENGILKPKTLKNIFEILEKAAKNSQKEKYIFSKINKTDLVVLWLWGFSDEWEKYSPVKISEGRYDEKEMKYISPAMKILDEIAKPLGISNSQLAETIKIYRKDKSQENEDIFDDE